MLYADMLKEAKSALAAERDAFKRSREAEANKIRRVLPEAAALERGIRGAFLDAMSEFFSDPDEIGRLSEKSLALQTALRDLLKSRGFDENALFDAYFHPECKDAGYINAKPCRCLAKHVLALELPQFTNGGFPEFGLDAFPDEPSPDGGLSQRENTRAVKEYCRLWAENFSGKSANLFINGATGLGKTSLSACAALRVAERGFHVVYVSAPELCSALERDRFSRSDDEDVTRFPDCDLLIIDDLGCEYATPLTQSCLYQLLNTRMVNNRKTIINANLSEKNVRERYIEPTASRITGGFKWLYLYGRDVRRSSPPAA